MADVYKVRAMLCHEQWLALTAYMKQTHKKEGEIIRESLSFFLDPQNRVIVDSVKCNIRLTADKQGIKFIFE